MYRPTTNPAERTASLTLVLAIHAGLLLAFLNLTGAVPLPSRDELTQLINISPQPPPPPIIELEPQKAAKPEGEASPKNIKSQATPVVAPKPPPLVVPTPNPIVASPTPKEGNAPTQGAAPTPGPGTGAGGTGQGTGAGGQGSGPGGGGEGLATVRTRLATRPLSGRDFPPELLDRWPPGRQVLLRFRVDSAGNVIQCDVFQSSGDATIDSAVCNAARQRLRYRPGLDRNGQRVADWAAYGQRPPR